MDVVSAHDPCFEALPGVLLGSFRNIETTVKWWTRFANVSLSYIWVQEYTYYPRGLGWRKGVSTWFLGLGTNLDSMHEGTSLGLGPEFRYVIEKVLGIQDRPALQLAFIYITFGLI